MLPSSTRIYFDHLSTSDELRIGERHQEKILESAHRRGAGQLPPGVNPLQLYSTKRAVRRGIAVGAMAGAAGGGGLGALIGGVGAVPGAAVGAVVGAASCGVLAYCRVKHLNKSKYTEWKARLSEAQALAFKQIFENDPEMKEYQCSISGDVITLPVSLPCGHVFDYKGVKILLERAKSKTDLNCPMRCGDLNIADVRINKTLMITINQTYVNLLMKGTTSDGIVLTAIQKKGLHLLRQDLIGTATDLAMQVVNEVMQKIAASRKKISETSEDELEKARSLVNDYIDAAKIIKQAGKEEKI